jgi:hypothetical protein
MSGHHWRFEDGLLLGGILGFLAGGFFVIFLVIFGFGVS